MKTMILGVAMAAILAGCSSGVPLNNPPVEDRTASVPLTTGDNAGAGRAGGSSQTGVTAVDLSKNGQDPAAMAVHAGSVVYFDYDSFIVKPQYQNVVEAQARYLRADAHRKAMLEGHTDERGGREYNLALGQRRAEAVSRALSLLGVTNTQLEAVSFGKEKPAVEGHDEVALAQNRRVEIKVR